MVTCWLSNLMMAIAAIKLTIFAPNKKAKKPYAAFSGVKIAAISVDKIAPNATAMAPDNPDALPARSVRTFMTPTLQLGRVKPLPMPINTVAPKIVNALMKPQKTAINPMVNPATDTMRPIKIKLFMPMRFIKRPDKKLPNTNPNVIEPM